MVCIYCNSDTEVTNSRTKAKLSSVWRRRQCKQCVAQFSTSELPDYAGSIVVTKQNGKLEPFSRDKLFLSLYQALGHRADVLKSSTALTTTIISQALKPKNIQHSAIKADQIIDVCIKVLRRYDPLAANTYKAYHLSNK